MVLLMRAAFKATVVSRLTGKAHKTVSTRFGQLLQHSATLLGTCSLLQAAAAAAATASTTFGV